MRDCLGLEIPQTHNDNNWPQAEVTVTRLLAHGMAWLVSPSKCSAWWKIMLLIP